MSHLSCLESINAALAHSDTGHVEMAAAATRGPFLVRASYHWAVPLDAVLTCSNCPATILEADADYAGWRYRSGGVGEPPGLLRIL